MKTLRTAAAPLLTEVTFPEALDLNAHPDEDHVFEIDGAFRESWSLEDRIDRRLMMEFRSRLPEYWIPRLVDDSGHIPDLNWLARKAGLLAEYRAPGVEVTKA